MAASVPCPSASGASVYTRKPLSTPPTVGTISSIHHFNSRAVSGKRTGSPPGGVAGT
jgi:hypothetical protein